MTGKKLLTTGEVSKLLNISRSTVSRKFDKGVLFGQKNQITGERLVSQESLTSFMEQYHLPVDRLAMERKKILMGLPDDKEVALIQKVFSKDERVQIERVGFGCDILVWASKEHPDLLIIDEDLPDIPATDVIKSLRRMEDVKDLTILGIAKASRTQEFRERGIDQVLGKDAVESEISRTVYTLLGIPPEQAAEVKSFEHQRRWPRSNINLPAKIGVYRLKTPYLREAGKAVLRNISYGGTFLSNIELEKGVIPAEPFRFLLEVNQAPLTNWRVHCKVVRLQSNGEGLTAGVQFMRLTKPNRRMLEAAAVA
jgi:DNA-binding NarL/FixJ family response regulator